MIWIAPSEKNTATATLDKRLWNDDARDLEATIANNVTEILET